uniref:VOC domain-containing protein n=1 Tax=Hucho hucho TaxID=62062 RepID=A0A4W5KUV0_9TELE
TDKSVVTVTLDTEIIKFVIPFFLTSPCKMSTKSFWITPKIEHIGIAVKNLEVSNLLFEKLFGAPAYKQEEVASEGVKTSFFMNGPNKIELLEATNPESPIAKFLEKKGEGIHHIAFDVEDILSEIERLKSEGFTVLNEIPKKGADNKLVAFLHPKGTNGVLIELCQEIK